MATRTGKNAWLTGAMASAAFIVAAATLPAVATAQTKGGDVVVAQGSNPPSLDGMVTSSQASRNINMNIYETLVGFSDEVKPIPILAESIEVSDDGMTYTFPLRKGVKFHNGKEMTATDVKASLERYRKVGATGNLLDPVESIDITGDYEVTFKMKAATPTFIEAFASPRAPAVIIPAEEADAEAGKTKFTGTGPFKFVEYVPDSHVKLERFEDYSQRADGNIADGFGGKKTAWFDTVTFRIMPEGGARIAALEAGEVHLLEQIPVPAAKRLASDPNIQTYENIPWAMMTFIMNTNVPPTDNIKFREAVHIAINNEEAAAIATEGLYQLDHGWQYAGSTYDAGDIGKEYYNVHDVDRAKALLKEAGYNGEEFILLTDSNIPEHGKAGVVIGENLKAAGINVKMNMVDWPTALKVRLQDEGWNGWNLNMGIEPYLGPVGLFATLTGKRPHFVKNDPVLDQLQEELTTGKTVEARQATMKKLQAQMYKNFNIVRVGNAGRMQAARANVKGFRPSRFTRMYDVWFDG